MKLIYNGCAAYVEIINLKKRKRKGLNGLVESARPAVDFQPIERCHPACDPVEAQRRIAVGAAGHFAPGPHDAEVAVVRFHRGPALRDGEGHDRPLSFSLHAGPGEDLVLNVGRGAHDVLEKAHKSAGCVTFAAAAGGRGGRRRFNG